MEKVKQFKAKDILLEGTGGMVASFQQKRTAEPVHVMMKEGPVPVDYLRGRSHYSVTIDLNDGNFGSSLNLVFGDLQYFPDMFDAENPKPLKMVIAPEDSMVVTDEALKNPDFLSKLRERVAKFDLGV